MARHKISIRRTTQRNGISLSNKQDDKENLTDSRRDSRPGLSSWAKLNTILGISAQSAGPASHRTIC
jgi:hypothetical protein